MHWESNNGQVDKDRYESLRNTMAELGEDGRHQRRMEKSETMIERREKWSQTMGELSKTGAEV